MRLMLDLCSGTKSASQPARERGWEVVTIDIAPELSPDIVADVREFTWQGRRPDLVWASPPCTEFSRNRLPWIRNKREPDMSLVMACLRIIRETQPRWWVLENVRGAVGYFYPVLGRFRMRYGPFFLWGEFPLVGSHLPVKMRPKENYSSSRKDLRGVIPYTLANTITIACESAIPMFKEELS